MGNTFSNSGLVTYTKLSPNYSARTGGIDKITIHHMAGVGTVEACGAGFADPARKGSSNYGIGNDGRIGLYVPEQYRAWTSSNRENDNRAVTIEVSNSATPKDGHPEWPVSNAAYKSLIDLCVDICQRNGIERLNYTGDANGNLTRHNMFANTACVPVDSEVLTKTGWVALRDINVGDVIACADLDNLRISFEEVYAKVPEKMQDTYTNNDFTATKDHRMVYHTQYNKTLRVETYNRLLASGGQVYIPLAGHSNFDGLDMTNDMLRFYIAVQADGHYMYETLQSGERSYYGLEFHLRKQRKIDRILHILDAVNLSASISTQSNGTTKIRVYNRECVNIVKDICEVMLHDKCFTWDWLYLSPEQAALFLEELMLWDGCAAAKKYSSRQKINLDIVNAIAAINNVGSRVIGSDVQFRDTPYITLGEKTVRHTKSNTATPVSCVSVKTGVFLVRQHGKTFIIGNCPGPYLQERFPQIAAEVNARLFMADGGKAIWDYLRGKGLASIATAGVMGNLFAESGLNPINLQDVYEGRLCMDDAQYTAAVDNGTYTNFLHDGAGYGLAQWTWWSRKDGLLQAAKAANKSVGDPDVQLAYLWKELVGYGLVGPLNAANSVKDASNIVLLKYEQPKDQSEWMQQTRAGYAQTYYDKFCAEDEEEVTLDKFKALWFEMRSELQDNDASPYSQEARDWAVSKGIVAGGSATEFNGMWEDVLTREQMVTLLYRFAKQIGAA